MTTSRRSVPQHRGAPRQRGVILIIALIALVALSVAGVSLLRSVDTGTLVAGNMTLKQAAISASDAGVEAAVPPLQVLVDGDLTEAAAANYSPSYDPAVMIPAALTAATANPVSDVGGTGNTARYWTERMCAGAGAASAPTCHITPGTTKPYFRTTVRVDGPRGTTSFAQAMYNISSGISYAIQAAGNLKLDSNINIVSSEADVYSGGNIETSNNTHVSGVIEAQSQSGSPPGSGQLIVPAPTQTVPDFRPADYQKYAQYRLGNDCAVYERSGSIDLPIETQISAPGAKWLGWVCDGAASAIKVPSEPPNNWASLARWKLEDDNSNSTGLLYVEGRAYVASNPGGYGGPGPNPWVISIIATGDIEISGNTNMADYRQVGASWHGGTVPAKVDAIMLQAGVDLKMSGNVTQTGPESTFTARDHVWLSGTTTINGTLVSTELWNHNGLIDKTGVSGTTTITYNGGLGGSNTVVRIGWREIK